MAATIRRLVAEFLPEERSERGTALVDVLHLVVTQVLVPRIGGGRQALREWLVFDSDLKARMIENPPSLWPTLVQAEIENRATGLATSARRAFRAGLVSEADRRRTSRITAPGGDGS